MLIILYCTIIVYMLKDFLKLLSAISKAKYLLKYCKFCVMLEFKAFTSFQKYKKIMN